jgi:hypothetical protein
LGAKKIVNSEKQRRNQSREKGRGWANLSGENREPNHESQAVEQEHELAAEPDVESEQEAESAGMEVETEEESEDHESEEIEDREDRMLSD